MDISDKAGTALREQFDVIKKEIEKLPKPDIYELTRRSTLQISAAVAVDGAKSLFGGIMRDMGIMLLYNQFKLS